MQQLFNLEKKKEEEVPLSIETSNVEDNKVDTQEGHDAK